MLNKLASLITFSVFAVWMPIVTAEEPVAAADIMPTKAVPKITAKRAIVVDYATGKVLYAKNAQEKVAIASLQKMLTALCIMDRGNLTQKVTIATTDTQVVPSKLYLKAGHQYMRQSLLKALLVKSGNDVAKALARDAAGSQAKFSVVMNAKAKEIGMTNSHFKNAHGLTESGQYSCAYDAAIMARLAFHNETLRAYMGTKSYEFTYADGKKKTFTNTNKVLKMLSYCNGLKTGTTKASGKCLASSGTLNGRTAIVICLGSTNSAVWNDSKSLLQWALER